MAVGTTETEEKRLNERIMLKWVITINRAEDMSESNNFCYVV
jgi:hypothetical protein